MFEPVLYFTLFSIFAADWFSAGDGITRRLILEAAGSDPVLEAGKLKIDAAYPFRRGTKTAGISTLSSQVNDVRTWARTAEARQFVGRVRAIERRITELEGQAA